MGEFGDKFRTARENKNLSLDDVSNVTKIGSRMLQAIEEEHFDQLPGGVFNKGFIRAYAKHLGLDGEEAVTSYLACLRQAQIDAQAAWQPEVRPARPVEIRTPRAAYSKPALQPQSSTQVEELPDLHLPRAEDIRPPRRDYSQNRDSGIPWKILVASAVVIILAVVFLIRHSRGTHPAAASSSPATSTNPVASAPLTTSAPSNSNPPSVATASASRPASHNQPAPNALSPVHAATAVSSKSQAHADTSGAPANPASNVLAANDHPLAPSPVSGNAPPPAKPAASLTLVIRASETSWISVVADGQPVSQETLIAPADTSFRASREIVVRVGNAAGVNFLWNGNDVPPQGAEGEVMTFVFDSTGMHALPSASSPTQNP